VVKTSKNQNPRARTAEISQPVAKVIAGAFGKPGLMALIQGADCGEDENDRKGESPPWRGRRGGGLRGSPQIECRGKESGPSEEISKVQKLIEMGQIRAPADGNRSIGQEPEDNSPEDEGAKPQGAARAAGGKELAQGH